MTDSSSDRNPTLAGVQARLPDPSAPGRLVLESLPRPASWSIAAPV